MKIAYFADGPWAHKAFDRILESDYEIVGMILRYENPDQVLQEKAHHHGIQFTWIGNVNTPNFLDQLRSFEADLGVSMSFNQIFKKDLIELFPLGLINCHAGKLPYYRGRNILNWALINGEDEIGVTCHYVDESVDTGDIILQETIPVTEDDDYKTILNKAFEVCSEVLIHSIELIQSDKVIPKPQPEVGTYFIRRKIGDEFINWSWRTKRIFNFVRAITDPGPSAQSWIEFNGEYALIYIKKVRMVQDAISYICSEGGIVGKSKDGNPLVKTGDSILEILEYKIEHPEKNKLTIGDRMGINLNLIYLWKNKKTL